MLRADAGQRGPLRSDRDGCRRSGSANYYWREGGQGGATDGAGDIHARQVRCGWGALVLMTGAGGGGRRRLRAVPPCDHRDGREGQGQHGQQREQASDHHADIGASHAALNLSGSDSAAALRHGADMTPSDPAPHAHEHDHIYLGARHDDNARRTRWVVALTAVMMVGEIIAGYWTGSMALLADGFHMATHAGALAVAALAYGFAKRHALNPRFSFGTGKVGDLAGFASALLLGTVALGIGVESALRLVDPTPVAFGQAAVVAVLGLAVNIVSALLLSGGHHHHGHDYDHADHHGHDHHHHGHDNNLRSAYFHVLADALTSVLAIIALLAGRYLGWLWLDPAMGIVGAVVIARWSWTLMRDTATILLDSSDPALAAAIRTAVEAPGDARITDLHVWRVGPDAYAAIVSVVGPPTLDRAGVAGRLSGLSAIRHLSIECLPGRAG